MTQGGRVVVLLVVATTGLFASGCGGQKAGPPREAQPVRRVEAEPIAPVPPPTTQPREALVRTPARQGPTGASLYERLGGEGKVRQVVDDLVARIAEDESFNFTRSGRPNEWEPTPENVERLKERVVQFISVTAGAPKARYEGKDMVTAHQGMGITGGEFDAFTAHLKAALAQNNVAEAEQQELLDAMESTRAAIFEGPRETR